MPDSLQIDVREVGAMVAGLTQLERDMARDERDISRFSETRLWRARLNAILLLVEDSTIRVVDREVP